MTLIDLYIDGPSVDDSTGDLMAPVTDARPHGAATTPDADEAPGDEGPLGTSYPRCADGNGTLTHLFFSDDEFDIARAKAICSRCGLAEACLAGALDRAEPIGVWGGSLLVDGIIVEVKRGRGRPPKQPRPPLVVDEVPIPPHLVA
jgi:WhiB family transcriptional regulator, redox-sensing transcriptional regulator